MNNKNIKIGLQNKTSQAGKKVGNIKLLYGIYGVPQH